MGFSDTVVAVVLVDFSDIAVAVVMSSAAVVCDVDGVVAGTAVVLTSSVDFVMSSDVVDSVVVGISSVDVGRDGVVTTISAVVVDGKAVFVTPEGVVSVTTFEVSLPTVVTVVEEAGFAENT